MNIFICWSGRRGKSAAEHLAAWLTRVFGELVVPKVSLGIDKGMPWREQLVEFVNESAAGLLCMTPEALRSPWVNYEAGMLSRSFGPGAACPLTGSGRIYTFLLGVSAAELNGPLAAFQSSDASDDRDVRRLVESLAATLGERPAHLQPAALDASWPILASDLRDRLAIIPAATLPETYPGFEDLFRRKTFEEPTEECVNQRWLERYDGARDTLSLVRRQRPAVERACRGYAVDLYRDLEAALDSFAMAVSLLVGSPRFALDDAGLVRVEPPGAARACEERRRRIRHLVARLVDPGQAPFFDDAVRFEEAEELSERKNLIHRQTPGVQELAEATRGRELPATWPDDAFCFRLVRLSLLTGLIPPASTTGRQVDLETGWGMSDWDFDRIMYALFLEHRLRMPMPTNDLAEKAVDLAEAELERARAREPKPAAAAAAITLSHVLEPLQVLDASAAGSHAGRIGELGANVVAFLDRCGIVDDALRTVAERIRSRFAVADPDALPSRGVVRAAR